jgi:hypothetical protein
MAPASKLSRNAGKRLKLRTMTVRVAVARAITTDQRPATAPIVVSPHTSWARNEKSSRGRTTSDIRKLSAPFTFTAVNLPKFNWRLRVASGLVSFAFGTVLIDGIGFAEGGLFTDAPIWEPH